MTEWFVPGGAGEGGRGRSELGKGRVLPGGIGDRTAAVTAGLGGRRRQSARISVLAGWLFADLFLVLFMVALASVPSASLAAKSKPAKARTPSTAHSIPATSRKHTATSSPGMSNTPIDICVSQESTSVVADFDTQVKRSGMAGRKIGFIISFATGVDPEAADVKATNAFDLIRDTDPDRAALATAGGEGLWGGESNSCQVNGGTDNYHFQVFFYK